MNTLRHHVLLYDKDCPLCELYTSAFIKTGMLEKTGRQDFCTHAASHTALDLARAKDEIALINTKTGRVIYGIDSLFNILGNAFPIFLPIFKNRVFKSAMAHFYAFISFNRKVIAPARAFEAPGSCTPSFSLGHRWAYIFMSWVFTAFILSEYAAKLVPLVPASSFMREGMVCGGQLLFQGVVVFFLRKERLVHYLGNLMTVSNIGALLLLPALLIPELPQLLYLGWFGCVVTFMLFEHTQRIKILEVPVWASVGWVIYRLLVLAIIYAL